MISGGGRGDELEPEQIAIGPCPGPNHPCMLDGFVAWCRPNPQRADVIHRHAHVDGDSEASDAGVDRQARGSGRGQELDFSIESPATKLTARATMHGDVSTALR